MIKSLTINITEEALKQKEELLDSIKFGIIYGHKCTLNEKWYVGQTSQKKPISRWGLSGKRYLEKEKDGSFKHKRFAPAIVKYGWDAFEHYILGYYPISELDKYEKFWISEKESFINGYNSTDGSEPTNRTEKRKFKDLDTSKYSHPVSDEMKEYLRKINLGKKHSEETKKKMSETRTGKKLKPFTEEHKRKLSEATKKKIGPLNSFYGKHHSEEVKQKLREKSSKAVIQIDPKTNKELNIFSSATEAAKIIGLSNCSTISHCCNGKQKTTGGYKWKYKQ